MAAPSDEVGVPSAGRAPAIVRALLESAPATAMVRDADGRVPLHLAAQCSPTAGVTAVLLAAAPMAAATRDSSGQLPLHRVFQRHVWKTEIAAEARPLSSPPCSRF